MKHGCLSWAVRLLLWIVILPVLVIIIGVTILYYSVRNNVPDITAIQNFTPQAVTKVLDRTGETIAVFQDPRIRFWIPIKHVPPDVINAIICAEDPNFFSHNGVDIDAIWEAATIDLQNMAYVRGASTITQQVIKNLFLTREKTLTRKIKEVILATQLERLITKRQILEQYFNQVEWGENLHGIEAASRYYFGKPADQLRIHEGALLAGMLPNPEYFNPYERFDKLRMRERIILKLMWKYRKINKAQYEDALALPIILASGSDRPYSVSELKSRYRPKPMGYRLIIEDTLEDYLGVFRLWQGGLTLRTSLDLETVKQAEKLLGRPEKVFYRHFTVLRHGAAIIAFGMSPKKVDPNFEKWLMERSLQSEVVEDALPWKQIIVTGEEGSK